MDKTLFQDIINTVLAGSIESELIRAEGLECVSYGGLLFSTSVWVDGLKQALEPALIHDAERKGEDILVQAIPISLKDESNIKEYLRSTHPNESSIEYLALSKIRLNPLPEEEMHTEKFHGRALSQRKQVIEKIVEEISGLKECQSLIDVGCGDGRLLAKLNTTLPALNLWGVESNKECIPKAKESTGGNATIQCQNAEDMSHSIPEKRFDCATAIGLFDTQITTRKQSHQIISEIHKLLKPGGTLITTPYTKPTLTTKDYTENGFTIQKKTVPENYFTGKEPKELIHAEKKTH